MPGDRIRTGAQKLVEDIETMLFVPAGAAVQGSGQLPHSRRVAQLI